MVAPSSHIEQARRGWSMGGQTLRTTSIQAGWRVQIGGTRALPAHLELAREAMTGRDDRQDSASPRPARCRRRKRPARSVNWIGVIRPHFMFRPSPIAVAALMLSGSPGTLSASELADETRTLMPAGRALVQLAGSSSTGRSARSERAKGQPAAGPPSEKSATPRRASPGQPAREKNPGSADRKAGRPAEVLPAPRTTPEPRTEPASAAGKADPEDRGGAPPPVEKGVDPFDEAACRDRLTAAGIGFELLPGIFDAGGCGAAAPLRVTLLAAGVRLNLPATLTCRMAEALASWTSQAVVPEAERLLGAKPAEVLIGTTYMCRPRNYQAGAKLSEHGLANAVDLVGFKPDGRPALTFAEFYDDGSAQAQFLAEIRKSACKYFTTVLGPGSDESHKIHMHVDMRQRRSDVRICQ